MSKLRYFGGKPVAPKTKERNTYKCPICKTEVVWDLKSQVVENGTTYKTYDIHCPKEGCDFTKNNIRARVVPAVDKSKRFLKVHGGK